MFENLIFLLFAVSITYLANKKNLIPNFTGDPHQKFFKQEKVPLIGGILILISLSRFYLNDIIILSFVAIFLVGFLSDSKILSSPKLRFFLQLIVVSSLIFYFKIEVTPTRIDFIDNLLLNKTSSLIFSIFCFMILINGSNFIDGLNGLLLGYVLLIIFVLKLNGFITFYEMGETKMNYLIFSFIFIIFLNYLNYLFLGDGGAYLLGLFIGYVLVSIYNSYSIISPYYIILLLWYPCFGNLFSLLRKFINAKSPFKPDNKHLHQLIFLFLKSKIKRNDLNVNIISSLMINFFNLCIFMVASINPSLTIFQLELLLLCLFTYCLIYFILDKKARLVSKK